MLISSLILFIQVWLESNFLLLHRLAIETIERLTESLDLTEYSSMIIHPLVRVLDTSHSLQIACMDALTALAGQLGNKYNIFIPMVHKITVRHRIHHQRYQIQMTKLLQVLGAFVWNGSPCFQFSEWRSLISGYVCIYISWEYFFFIVFWEANIWQTFTFIIEIILEIWDHSDLL